MLELYSLVHFKWVISLDGETDAGIIYIKLCNENDQQIHMTLILHEMKFKFFSQFQTSSGRKYVGCILGSSAKPYQVILSNFLHEFSQEPRSFPMKIKSHG